MASLFVATLCSLLSICSGSFVILEKPDEHDWRWSKIERSDPSTSIDLVFALKQQNVDKIRDILLNVSTPSHAHYGQHLSMESVQRMTAPSDETTFIVKQWLTSNGIHPSKIQNATPNGDFLRIETNIAFAEKLLKTEYFDYSSSEYGNNSMTVSRVDHEKDYFVPDSIAPYLDFVSPTKRFPSPMQVNSTFHSQKIAATVTPDYLRTLYAVGSNKGKSDKNMMGVASFLEQFYSEHDLETFWRLYDVSSTNVTNVPSNESSGHGVEAQLDVQYITSMGEKISTQVWYTPGSAPDNSQNEPFLTWLLNVESATDRPLLFSISYGETEQSVGYDYASRINTEFAKLGATGMSLLFASGDSGAAGNCTASNGRETANFPAGSPYVTAVGGTESSHPEVAWSNSGGGFSDYWPAQSWQLDAINGYKSRAAQNLPASNKWNESGRGYPDISAQSVDFEIINYGVALAVSGTSCAAPTASGIFALLNDLRLQNDLAPLGFLNPLIYEIAAKDEDAFNDITSGQNIGCEGKAFPAEKGWDAVTGNGTPDYEKLAKYVLESGEKTRNEKSKTFLV